MSCRKICKGSPQRNVPNEGGLGFSVIFDQYVVISGKRCILDTKLLWNGNRKQYASYWMVSVLMTLSDPCPGFQGHSSFKGEYIENGALHWLPVCERVDFKVATFVHQSLSGILPPYLANDCRLVADARERRLHSTASQTCVVTRT